MSINIYSLLYLLVGLGLGLLYFGGLWLTIKNMNQARSPIVLTLGSFILRTGAVFLVLIYVARQGIGSTFLFYWSGLLLLGFF